MTMKKVIAAIAAAFAVLSLAGCGGTSSALSVGTLKESAQNLVEALGSSDYAKMKQLTTKGTLGKGTIVDVKPTKGASDVKIARIDGSTVTISYKIDGKQFNDNVKFILRVDGKGNATYIPDDPPYAMTSYAGITLNGTKLNNKNGSKAYFMPGVYQVSYEDDLVEYSGAATLSLGGLIDFGSPDNLNEPNYEDGDGNLHLLEKGKPSKKYAETVKQALVRSASDFTCEGMFDSMEKTKPTVMETVNSCKATAGGDVRFDMSNVTVTTGESLNDMSLGGTVRAAVGWSSPFESENIDVNDLKIWAHYHEPRGAKATSSTVSFTIENGNSALRGANLHPTY